MHNRTWTKWLFAALLMWVPPMALAQSSDSGPALGVARVSLINGDVTTQRGGDGDWVKAGVNTPLIEGDTIQTGPGSRAEVQLDYSNLIRLDGATEVEVSELANRQFRVRLIEGRITYSELRNGEADVDIETPHIVVRPAKNGRYEIEARYDETTVQVRKGEAEVVSSQGIEVVRSGKLMTVRDEGQGLEFRLTSAERRGEWDDWNRRRDDRLNKSESYRYVSRSISGAHELDEYGDWRYVSGYGNVWYPQVGAAWAPYRQGRWSYIDYYGWNWIGYEPWGWAPYHYGRWFHNASYGWGWYPGRYRYSHSWRPALVSFFGYGGRGFSLGVGLGYGSLYSSIGWCPLAPGEAYYPWYGGRGGRNSINNTTIINNTNIYNTFRNARTHNGVTVVDAQGFSQGRMNNVNSVRGIELQRATSIRGQIPVVPSRNSQGTVVRTGAARSSGARAAVTAGGVTRANAARTGVRSRASFDQQRQQAAGLVQRLDRPSAGVRASGTGAPSTGVRAGANSSPARSRAGAPSAGVRAGSRATAQPSARSGARPSTTTRNDSGWRSFESNRTGSDVRVVRGRNGATTTRAPSGVRSGTSTSRVDRAAPSRSRSGSANSGVIPRTTSRVGSRSSSSLSTGSRSTGARSAPSVSSSSSRLPTRSTSRVPSARSAPSRSQGTIPRASSRRSSSSRVPSASRAPSSYPSRSSSRIPSARSAPSRSRSSSSVYRGSRGGSFPSSRSGGYGGGARSAPSRAPSVRSAPSRSAPSRSSGGGGVRSAPSRAPSSRSSGGARSAPSRSRSR